MAEDIGWIIEFERLARPRLQKIFEKDLVKLPVAIGESAWKHFAKRRRPTERMLRPNASGEAELLVSKKPHLCNCAVGCT